MTYLEIVNTILRKMREGEVSSVQDTSYSKLIGDFVNEAKEMVEEAWNWTKLRQVITVTTSSSDYEYPITGTNGGRPLFSFTKCPIVWNQEEEIFLSLSSRERIYKLLKNTNPQEGIPYTFHMAGRDSNNDPIVWFWNIPDGVYNIDFHYIVPQAKLTNNTDEPIVSSRAIIYGATALAIEDRGEDGGTGSSTSWERFHSAINDAIIADSGFHPNETLAVSI